MWNVEQEMVVTMYCWCYIYGLRDHLQLGFLISLLLCHAGNYTGNA
jgi:hypothetical protein